MAVLEKTAGSYDVTHLLLPDPTSNRMLAEQYINGATSHTIWPLHDQQGTVIAAISDDWHDDQDDVQHFKYDAYGLLKFDTEQDPSLANRLVSLHAGRDWDEVSDLYYNNARWYDPAMQRFISQDPLGFGGGDTNLYRYCGNSPTNATDPSGFVIETGWDIFSVVVGIGSVGLDIYNIATTGEGWGDLGLDLFGLGVDVGAAFVPFVPGGMSVAMKARRAYRIADTAIDIGRKIDTGINAYQAVQSGIASYDAYQRGDYWNMALSGVGAGLGGLHFGIRGVQGVKHFRDNFEIVGLPNARSFATSPSSGGLGALTDVRIKRKINAPGKVRIIDDAIPQYGTPFKPLSKNQRATLRAKADARTITKQEYQHLQWDRRFGNRRATGVRRFWAQERASLRAGEPGTRAWTPEQAQDILAGRTPTFDGEPITGHHLYNALDHPHVANEPWNIYPATRTEHLQRWHGGNWQNDTFGSPLNLLFGEEF